jgi:hypothetical protein
LWTSSMFSIIYGKRLAPFMLKRRLKAKTEG